LCLCVACKLKGHRYAPRSTAAVEPRRSNRLTARYRHSNPSDPVVFGAVMVGEIPYESVPERTTKPNVKIKPRKGHASSRRGVGRISPRFAGALGRRQGQPVFVARHETARIANMLLKLMRGLTNCRSQHQRPAEAQSRSYIPLNSPGEHRAWRDEDVHVFENVGHSTPCSVAPTCHVCRAGCGDRDFMSGRITRTAQFAVFRAPRRRLGTGSRRWGS